MTRRARQRLRIAFVAVLCLLFQQVALASYLCPIEQMPPEMTVMAEDCAEMGMPKAQDNPSLCAKHCSPDQSVAADSAKLSVPGAGDHTAGVSPGPCRARLACCRAVRSFRGRCRPAASTPVLQSPDLDPEAT